MSFSCLLFTARISNFVSDSTPANQQSVVLNLSIPKKTKPTLKTLLECGYNPKFSLDEDKLPAEFTPQVLLDDDFNQLVDATGHPDEAVISTAKKVITPPTAATRTVNSPIDNVFPGTSTSPPVKYSLPSNVEKASSCTASKSQSFGATGSPFTRFIFKRAPEKGGSSAQEAEAKALSSTNASLDAAIIDSGKTRETRLEELLSDAVEEATEKVKRKSFRSPLLSSQIQMTLSPKSTEHGTSETSSPNKSTAGDQADFRPNESDTDTTSDSDLSSGDGVITRETHQTPIERRRRISTTETSKATVRFSRVNVPQVPHFKVFRHYSRRRCQVPIQVSMPSLLSGTFTDVKRAHRNSSSL